MAKNNIFEKVKVKAPSRSKFDLSHDVKMSLKFGYLYPSMVMECVPGDQFTISCESLIRVAPLLAPLMHRIDVFMHYYFVPTRILWDGWEDFVTQQPWDGVPPTHPFFEFGEGGTIPTDLAFLTYFGLPQAYPALPSAPIAINPFPFAAYQVIYNEYYRDQNLIAEVDYKLDDGDNSSRIDTDFCVRRLRAWEHDYFTSALPFAQKGVPVKIPMNGIVELSEDLPLAPGKFVLPSTGIATDTGAISQDGVPPNVAVTIDSAGQTYDPQGSLVVNNAEATINDLRRAYRLQEWYEKQARGGTRYIEAILAHFGVRSSDARLQRPEYITGTKTPVTISEVLNSAGVEGGPVQGNMAGHGVSVVNGNYGKHFCEEHGYIIGIMSVMPKTAYQQGVPKMFLKTNDVFEYFWTEFANIGEQEIKHVELYGESATADTVFGYIPRYAEYKYMNNRTAGEFQDELAYWHMTRIFDEQPLLNQEFIECVPRTDIFPDTSGNDYLYAHIYHQIKAIRPMPFYGTPTF